MQNMSDDLTIISVSLPLSMKKELSEQAKREGRPMSVMIREALKNYLILTSCSAGRRND